mmetsp:Transcript_32390/g.84778  ORF Transcript_32390/g.84778 Transcript_32390/m.84778 type:complete len:593 (-) Transcript_32390:873-2651(-)
MPSPGFLASNGVNLAHLRDYIRKELLDAISAVEGHSKALFMDKSLIGVLGLVAEFSALKERGVEKMFPLGPGPLPGGCPKSVIFLCRPKAHLIPLIAEKVKGKREAEAVEGHILFTPSKTMVVEKALKEFGIYGSCQLREFKLLMAPMDSDLISMEMPLSLKASTVYGDHTALHYAAEALMQMQYLYGIIPRVAGKGEAARHVANMMSQLLKEQGDPKVFERGNTEIDAVILIDRSVDLITPLCSQLTYEGLVDELYGITNNLVELPEEVAPLQANGKPVKVELNSGDKLYSEIRDMNFSRVGPLLSSRAKSLSREYDERHGAKTVSEIKQFTSKLKRLQDEQLSLRMHTDIAADVMLTTARDEFFLACLNVEQTFLYGDDTDKSHAHIESCICKKEPLLKVLRMICLQSVVNGGLKQKLLDFYRREILQTYGFEHILTLDNLEKAGLLTLQESRSSYNSIRKSLRLIVDDDPEQEPEDISHVYSGYAPLTVRIIEALAKPGGLRSIEEVLKLLPGPHFDLKQDLPKGFKAPVAGGADGRQPKTVVFFLGGCTYAEIAAVRFLGSLIGREFTIATTNVINGSTMLETLMEKI